MNSKKGESLLSELSWQVNVADLLPQSPENWEGMQPLEKMCCSIRSGLMQWLSLAPIASQVLWLCRPFSPSSSWCAGRPVAPRSSARAVQGRLNLIPPFSGLSPSLGTIFTPILVHFFMGSECTTSCHSLVFSVVKSLFRAKDTQLSSLNGGAEWCFFPALLEGCIQFSAFLMTLNCL